MARTRVSGSRGFGPKSGDLAACAEASARTVPINEADGSQHASFAKNHADYIAAVGADGHAHADFLGALDEQSDDRESRAEAQKTKAVANVAPE